MSVKIMGKKLFIGGLSWGTSEETLQSGFEEFGEVEEVVIPRDRHTGKSRGFGFVLFADEEGAEKAREEMDNKEFDGRTIRVDWARERERRPRSSQSD